MAYTYTKKKNPFPKQSLSTIIYRIGLLEQKKFVNIIVKTNYL